MDILLLHPDRKEWVQERVAFLFFLLPAFSRHTFPSETKLIFQGYSKASPSMESSRLWSPQPSERRCLSCLCLGSACSPLWWENAPPPIPFCWYNWAPLFTVNIWKQPFHTWRNEGRGGLNALAFECRVLSTEIKSEKPKQLREKHERFNFYCSTQ